MTNNSGRPVDFKCRLYAPNRRAQRSHVFHLTQVEDLKTYYFPNGRQLVGEMLLLKAEELGGQRMLNHRFVAEE